MTENECGDIVAFGGDEKMVYFQSCADEIAVHVMDLATRSTYKITDHALGNPSGYDFDGERWVVWIYNDYAYKYDVIAQDPPWVIDNTLRAST